ncbi:GNAT family N-acetyltransferase [Aurantivibrio plasticivorans]
MPQTPLTRIAANDAKQQSIRDVIQNTVDMLGVARIVDVQDAQAFTDFLSDPRISKPIYTLPNPINQETVTEFIKKHLDERNRGEGLLLANFNNSQQITGYYDIQVWPEWSACELGGAISPEEQSSGKGGSGALATFNWLFDVVGVDLICETAALDNIRTAKLLERIGFKYKGEIESTLPGGGTRPSRYWELSRTDWLKRREN